MRVQRCHKVKPLDPHLASLWWGQPTLTPHSSGFRESCPSWTPISLWSPLSLGAGWCPVLLLFQKSYLCAPQTAAGCTSTPSKHLCLWARIGGQTEEGDLEPKWQQQHKEVQVGRSGGWGRMMGERRWLTHSLQETGSCILFSFSAF